MQVVSDLSHFARAKAINISRQNVLGQIGNGSCKASFQFIDLLSKQERGSNTSGGTRPTIQCERHEADMLNGSRVKRNRIVKERGT